MRKDSEIFLELLLRKREIDESDEIKSSIDDFKSIPNIIYVIDDIMNDLKNNCCIGENSSRALDCSLHIFLTVDGITYFDKNKFCSDGESEKGEKSVMERKIFISHSSLDAEYVKKIVDLFIDMGVRENQIICTSVPGFGIPMDEDIYDYLQSQFNEFEIHVVFVLSQNYYNSVASMNEMGAAWVLHKEYTTILLPGFEYKKIDGAINPRQISLKLDENKEFVQEKLGQIKNKLASEFQFPQIADTRWEEKRDTFISEINSIVPKSSESEMKLNEEDDLELLEKGYYIKKSEHDKGINTRYCAACYNNTGKLYPIVQGSLRRDYYCSNCQMHYN